MAQGTSCIYTIFYCAISEMRILYFDIIIFIIITIVGVANNCLSTSPKFGAVIEKHRSQSNSPLNFGFGWEDQWKTVVMI